ncbi:SusC/RagA family TonB-linked outer membrane protein [Bacteroidia bacterium]|nr:SusC/RagA family TonB-linked outer membrane protein [Bacteroidia bacterium]
MQGGGVQHLRAESPQDAKIAVTGVVSDADGPIIGAGVVEKGNPGNGVATDVDGRYSLRVSPNATITVEYLGYTAQDVSVNGRTSINVTLAEDASNLEEVVVVGYGTQKKATLTGAISSAGADDIARSVASTSSGALVGKIAGVNSRQTDGRPGSGTKINIRNMGTPLYVIDGVQKDEGQFNNIDFNDIESVSILKDASASIYGMRAANGVVVVTTKRGKRGEASSVNVNAYQGWQDIFRYPEPADASTYISSYMQSDAILGNYEAGKSPRYTREDLAKWQQGTETGYRPFNWYDYVLNTAPQWYAGANVSGGSEKINYYVSLSHLDQTDMIVNYGGFYRSNVQMNIDANVSKKLKVGASFNGRIEERDHPGVPGPDDQWQALFATYRNLPTQRPFANDNPNYPAHTQQSEINFGMLSYDRSGHFNEVWRVGQLNFNAEYEIIKGLKLEGKLGYYYAQHYMNNQEFKYKLYDYDAILDPARVADGKYLEIDENGGGYYVVHDMSNPYRDREINYVEEVNTQVQLSYNTKIADKHNVSAFVVSESYLRETPRFWVEDKPASNALSLIRFPTMVGASDEGYRAEARLGYAGRLNYNYDEKYLFEASARYDGSWKFKPEHRWGFFPSASLGYRISQEDFWESLKVNEYLNDLKLRVSYGLMGDDGVGDYSAFGYMGGYDYGNGGAVLDGNYVVGAARRGLPNTVISWMEAKTFDVGFDFQMLGGKLSGQFDYFRRLMSGLSARRNDVRIPAEVGFDLPFENLNSNVTKGIDGALTWRDRVNVLGSDVYYNVGGNFTFARMMDWERYNPEYNNSWDEYRNSQVERYSYLDRWGYHVLGQFQSWEQIAAYPVDIDGQGNRTMRPGDFIYEDKNGDKRIDGYDERPIGYREGETPYLNFAFNLGAEWQGFDISADFTGAAYASYFLEWEAREPFHDGGNNPQYYLENQWRLSDITDPNSTLIPGKYPTVIAGNRTHVNYRNNDFWSLSVNYCKLRNLQIGYTLPKKWTTKVGIEKLRVYTLMQNLFSIDNLGDVTIDPEIVGNSGVHYPTTRVISVGANLTF